MERPPHATRYTKVHNNTGWQAAGTRVGALLITTTTTTIGLTGHAPPH